MRTLASDQGTTPCGIRGTALGRDCPPDASADLDPRNLELAMHLRRVKESNPHAFTWPGFQDQLPTARCHPPGPGGPPQVPGANLRLSGLLPAGHRPDGPSLGESSQTSTLTTCGLDIPLTIHLWGRWDLNPDLLCRVCNRLPDTSAPYMKLLDQEAGSLLRRCSRLPLRPCAAGLWNLGLFPAPESVKTLASALTSWSFLSFAAPA